MAYAARSDLEARMGSADRLSVLLADEQGLEIPGRLAGAIAQAEAEIDSGLGNFYAVPVAAPVPATVARWAADLALAALAESRPAPGGGNLAKKAERAREEIDEVRRGVRQVAGLAAKPRVGTVTEPDRTFTRGEDSAGGEAGTMDTW